MLTTVKPPLPASKFSSKVPVAPGRTRQTFVDCGWQSKPNVPKVPYGAEAPSIEMGMTLFACSLAGGPASLGDWTAALQ